MSASYRQHSHCSYCGSPFASHAGWPRACKNCGNISYRNPLPVSVVLVPVEDTGLLVVRRAIDPGRGKLALPGGFIEWGETWQVAGARELREETGLVVSPDLFRLFAVHSAPDGTLLVFGLAPQISAEAVAAARPGPENSALSILNAPAELAFPLHTRVVIDFFEMP